MSVLDRYNPHTRLNFAEVNIIGLNRNYREKTAFIERLRRLQSNTDDPMLLAELRGLIEKIGQLNDDEFKVLLADAESGDLLFPPDYRLPNISDISLWV